MVYHGNLAPDLRSLPQGMSTGSSHHWRCWRAASAATTFLGPGPAQKTRAARRGNRVSRANVTGTETKQMQVVNAVDSDE